MAFTFRTNFIKANWSNGKKSNPSEIMVGKKKDGKEKYCSFF